MGVRRPANSSLLAENPETIVNLLQTHGPLTRAELQHLTGFTRATVSTLVKALVDSHAISLEATVETGGRGRPSQKLSLNRDCPQYIGIAIQKQRASATVHNIIHEPLHSVEIPTPSGGVTLEVLERTVRHLFASARSQGLPLRYVRAVGCVFPGLLPNQRLSLPSADSRELAAAFEEFLEDWFGFKPVISGTARAAAWAELRHHPTIRDCLYFRVSDGVAVTQVTEGSLVTGTYRLAGEIGHITIDSQGDPCFCGKNGCLETFISNPALCRRAGVPSVYALLQGWFDNDPQIRDLLIGAMRTAGAELAHAALITDPGTIFVAWNLTQQIPELFGVLEESIRFGLLPALRRTIQIESAILPEATACANGAAYLAALP